MPREIVFLDCVLECIRKGPPEFPRNLICFMDPEETIIELNYQHGNKKNTPMTQMDAAKVWLAWDEKKNRVPDFDAMSDKLVRAHLTEVRQRFRQALKSLIQRGILIKIPTNDRHVERFRIATTEENKEHRKRTKAERKTKYPRSPPSSSNSEMSNPGSPNDRFHVVPSSFSPSSSSTSSPPSSPGCSNDVPTMNQTIDIPSNDLDNYIRCFNPETGMEFYVDAKYLRGCILAGLPPSASDSNVCATDGNLGVGCAKTQDNAKEPATRDTFDIHQNQQVLQDDSLSIYGISEEVWHRPENFIHDILDIDSQLSSSKAGLSSTEDPLWGTCTSTENKIGMCDSSLE